MQSRRPMKEHHTNLSRKTFLHGSLAAVMILFTTFCLWRLSGGDAEKEYCAGA